MRSLQDLINSGDSALPLIMTLLEETRRNYQLLPPSSDNARLLSALQVTTHSTLGAMAYETGGLLIDHGWLRVLGSGHRHLSRNLVDWNDGRVQGALLVADDAAGGFFAINGGGLGSDVGAMYYWAPDTLLWEPLDIGYSDFLAWALSDQLAVFYQDLRWEDWHLDVQALSADQCFSFYPFLWTQEGSVQHSHRAMIEVGELWAMHLDLARTLDGEASRPG
ncbi:DUF2625 family protein [Pseudomonas fluorescens]|uniref:DUF2625 family protein n=1 Tax=Pseudomonas fluorescens TaxID=294 RepID=UPI000641A206|nr:DUF2625 family protein [Pseudomonas fluorescens]